MTTFKEYLLETRKKTDIKWIATLKGGKTKTIWAGSHYDATQKLGTSILIQGGYTIKKAPVDTINEVAGTYGVFMTGGSIGDKKDNKPMATFDTKDEAVVKAKSLRKNRTPGERKHYNIKFEVRPINEAGQNWPVTDSTIEKFWLGYEEDMSQDDIRTLASHEWSGNFNDQQAHSGVLDKFIDHAEEVYQGVWKQGDKDL